MNDHPVENLTTRNIADFTTEDTVYISIPGSPGMGRDHKLCQFIKQESGKIYGKIINDCLDGGTNWKQKHLGAEVNAKFEHCHLWGQSQKDSSTRWHSCDVLGFFDRETEIVSEDELSKIPAEHESYGMAVFSRRNSNQNNALFGSSIQHKQTITLTIHQAEIARDLNSDWNHAKKVVTEIEMSQEQFSQLITSFNMGDGVPVTLRQYNGKRTEDVPYQSKMDQFHIEFTEKMKELNEDIKNIIQDATHILMNKKSINKADREYILKAISSLTQEIGSNVPFVAQQFGNQMDKTVAEAKGEIESFFQSKVTSLGLGAYKEELSKMLGTGDAMADVKIEE